MIDYQTFAQKIKQKYPEHQNEDDLALAQRFLDTYPVYKNRVSLPQAQNTQQQTPGQFQENPVVTGERFLGGGGLADTLAAAFESGRRIRQATNNYGMGGQVESNPFMTEKRAREFTSPLHAAQNVGLDVGEALMASPFFGLLASLVKPGTTRAAFAASKTIPEDVIRSRMGGIVQQAIDSEEAKTIRGITTRFLSKLFPMTEGATSKPSNVNLQKFYDLIKNVEQRTGAYGSSSPRAQAGELLSSEGRSLANEYGGLPIQLLNKYMSFLYKYGPSTVKRIEQGLGVGAGVGGVGLLAKLLGVPGFSNPSR